MVNPIIYTIKTKLNNFILKNSATISGLGLAKSLLKSITSRFNVCKTNSTYILATIIDPRIKVIMMDLHETNRAKYILEEEFNANNIQNTSIPNVTKSVCNSLDTTTSESLWDILNERSINNQTLDEPVDLNLKM